MESIDLSRLFVVGLSVVLVAAPAANASPAFEEVTAFAGLSHAGESYGAAWGDFTGDGFPDLFVNNHRDKVSFYANNTDGTFSDVTNVVDGSGVWAVAPKQDTHGGAWADFDGDGDQDLYVTTGGAVDGRMLVNEFGILFDRAPELGVVNDVEGRLPVWLDYDLDGDLDLAIMIRSASRVFRQNNGNTPSFSHVTNQVGLDCIAMDYGQLSDLDGSGIMELICGDGTFPQKVYDVSTVPFTDISDYLPNVARGTDSGTADFDGDLDPDFFVVAGAKIPSSAGLATPTRLEASLGSPPDAEKGVQFETTGVLTVDLYVKRQLRNTNRVHIGAGDVHPPDFSFTLDPADPDVEGILPRDPSSDNGVFIGYDPALSRWQMILTGLAGKPAGAYLVVRSTQIIGHVEMLDLVRTDLPERPYLLINTGNGFTEEGQQRGLDEEVLCISVAPGDFDNDGDVDTYLVCRGGVKNLPNRLYVNDGNGDFSLAQGGHGAEGVLGFHLADGAGLGESAVTADYDVDGCLDLFLTNGLPLEPGRHDSGPDQLFRNLCNYGNHWLQLDLEGLAAGAGTSNRDGIGARVYVTAGGVTQMREQNGGYHRWSQHFRRLHFGLGAAAGVTEVRVEWPNGWVDIFSDPVPADGVYLAREGATSLVLLDLHDGGPPSPPPGDECGEPAYDPGSDAGLFLWRDCPADTWHVRVTGGGGPSTVYQGQVTTSIPFSSPAQPFGLEANDVLDVVNSSLVTYALRVINSGQDGFSFEQAAGASTCFSLEGPNGAEIQLGATKLTVGTTLDLGTLAACEALPELSVADVAVDEATGNATFTVSLSTASADVVRVDYATADGSATAPVDYAAVSDTLILAAGTTGGEVSVIIVDDGVMEGAETFSLDLSNPVNAVIIDATATATINDPGTAINPCGEPDIDRSSEAGVFLWRDCPGGGWQMRVTAGGGPKIIYEGQVTADEPFPAPVTPFSNEGADLVDDSDPNVIVYSLRVANSGWDGLGFETPSSGATCFAAPVPGGITIYVGGEKAAVGATLDLATLNACEATP